MTDDTIPMDDEDLVTLTLPRAAMEALDPFVEYALVETDTDPWTRNALFAYLYRSPTYGKGRYTVEPYDTADEDADPGGPFTASGWFTQLEVDTDAPYERIEVNDD
jgi:hypothetical protein